MLIKKRFYEGDTGDNPTVPPVVEAAPATVVHTVQAVPPDTTRVVEDTAALPHAAINETLQGLTAATHALVEAANKLGEKSKEVVVEPTQAATETSAEIVPEITPPPPENRYVRRNGRKVKR